MSDLWVLYDGDSTFGTCKAVSDDAGAITLTVDASTIGVLSTTDDVTFTLGSDEAFTLTCSDISAPLVMTNTMTTAAKTGCRALFNVKANVALGSYVNAVKGYMQFTGTSGATTGLASGVCAELLTPNRTLPSGAYYPLEVQHVAGGTSVVSNGSGSRVGFIYMQNTTDLDGDFDDNGYLMTVAGLTAGAGHMLSAQSITLKAQVGLAGAESTRYLVMSSAEKNLTLATTSGTSIAIGACTTGIALTGACTTGVSIANTSLTDGIAISGTTPVDGIHISSNCSANAINIGAQTVTGILMAGDAAYNPIVIGTKSNTSTGGLNLAGATDDTGGIMVFADDGGASLASVTSPIWTRYLITTAQGASGPTATGMFAQLKTQGSITCTTGGYTALKAYNQAGTVTLVTGAEYGVINAGVTLEGNLVNTSGRFSGVDVNINTSAYTITDTATDSAGIHIRKTSGSTYGWPVGLKINDAGAITGIAIGTTTTGINIAAATTGITVAACTNVLVASAVGTGTDGWLLKAGATGTHLDAAAIGGAISLFVDCAATSGSNRTVYVESLTSAGGTQQNFGGRFTSGAKTGITVTAGAWNIGIQGKVVSAGTHATGTTSAAMLAQLNNGGTFEAGSALYGSWVDSQLAATPANGGAGGNFWMLGLTTAQTGACQPTAMIYAFGGAIAAFDFTSYGDVVWAASAGTLTTAAGYIKCTIAGATRYIPTYTTIA